MRKARPKLIISGQGRIRTRSAYRELPRPNEGGVCGWGTGQGGGGGVVVQPSGGSEVGSCTYSSREPGFLGREDFLASGLSSALLLPL